MNLFKTRIRREGRRVNRKVNAFKTSEVDLREEGPPSEGPQLFKKVWGSLSWIAFLARVSSRHSFSGDIRPAIRFPRLHWQQAHLPVEAGVGDRCFAR